MMDTLNSKWISTVASIWIQCTSGSLYTFSVYSSTLKSTLNYDQSTLDTISVFKDIGANAGVLSGVLYSYATSLATSYAGPWMVHLAGAIQCFFGYFFLWAAVARVIPPPPIPVVCLFMLVAAHAQSFFNTADVVTAVRNFPSYSGTAIGIMKGFLGLSGAILIQVYQMIFNNKPTSFLLMLAVLPTVNALFLMWFVRIYDMFQGGDKKLLDGFSLTAVIVAAYLMAIIILEQILTLPFAAHLCIFLVLILLLSSPLIIAIIIHTRESNRTEQTSLIEGEQLLNDSNIQDTDIHTTQCLAGYQHFPSNSIQEVDWNDGEDLQLGENLNLLQAICTLNFWILFFAMACGMGSGLSTVNNIGQIGESLAYTSLETNTLISLWSIWNFLGRFGAGYVSDYFLHMFQWERPLFMVITLATMSIGHLVIASGFPGALYAGSVIVGVCYGSQWSLMPTITSEIFGVGHMGTIFNTITIASPVGSYIFSVRVVGYIYDQEVSEGGSVCTGRYCFMLSFLIMAAATLLGSVSALILYFGTRNFYRRVLLRRLLIMSS